MDQPDRELTSWKEIADYLSVTVRTAQNWEKTRGLPVQRIPGGGRVFVRTEQLQSWRSNQGPPAKVQGLDFSNGSPPLHENTNTLKLPVTTLRRIAIAAILLVTIIVIAFKVLRESPRPKQFQVIRNTLIVTDEAGREIWRKTFDEGLFEQHYRASADDVSTGWFGDLDGDGTIEMVFVMRAEIPYLKSDVLICFGQNGNEKWRFVPGRQLISKRQTFTNKFTIASFRITRLAQERAPNVILVARHNTDFPTQVAVLSADGHLQREYWHSGHIGGNPRTLQIADLNGNGVSELYLGGVNNSRTQATLVVLDPDSMEGASSEERGYQLDNFPAGVEIARLFFERTCISSKLQEYNQVNRIVADPDGLEVSVLESYTEPAGPLILNSLLPNLTLKNQTLSDGFIAVHNRMRSESKLDHQTEVHHRSQFGLNTLKPQAITP